MTTIHIDGKITAIEVADEEAPFGYAEYSDNATGLTSSLD